MITSTLGSTQQSYCMFQKTTALRGQLSRVLYLTGDKDFLSMTTGCALLVQIDGQ